MLPYFDEYKVYLSEHMGKVSAETHIMRLVKLDRAEKNLLDMLAEEMFDILEVDKKARATLNAIFGCIELYLKWLDSNYNIPVFNCYYEVKKLKALTLKKNDNDTSKKFFIDFTELKNVLLDAENDYLSTQELEVSEKKLDTIYLKQKMFNAYVTLLWEQMSNDEILSLSLKEAMLIITSKQIVVNEKLVDLSDNEVDFLREAFDVVTKLHREIKYRRDRSKMHKRKFTIETYDNLFNASNTNILKNLKWDALGKSASDPRLQTPNIIKAGIFYKLRKYETENDYVFMGNKGFEVCCNLLNIPLSKTQRYLSEYNKFKRSLENRAKLSVDTI